MCSTQRIDLLHINELVSIPKQSLPSLTVAEAVFTNRCAAKKGTSVCKKWHQTPLTPCQPRCIAKKSEKIQKNSEAIIIVVKQTNKQIEKNSECSRF